MQSSSLFCATLQSPLGPLYALAHEAALLYLGFEDSTTIAHRNNRLRTLLLQHTLIVSNNRILDLVGRELALYFNHKLTRFTIPIELTGTPFQHTVWQALTTIPYGHTRSYKQQAEYIDKKQAYRAVGTAHGANMIAIVIPCHRVIAHNGTLGGYAGNLTRKEWLLKHESILQYQQKN